MMKVLRFIKALFKYVIWGDTASDKVFNSRIKICEECRDRCGKTCCICGCYLNKKAKWTTESCPKNKW